MSDKPSVSLITLTHNKVDVTRRCLTSWLNTAGMNWELIVIDNGSTDGTHGWLKTFAEQTKPQGVDTTPVLHKQNVGCSTARNEGLERARGESVVFIDNDVALRKISWLSVLSQALAELPACGLVGPKLLFPFEPFDIQCAGAAVAPTGRVQFRGRGESRENAEFNKRTEVQCLISACFMGHTEVIRRKGGFDEAFNPVEFEDIDLCYRLRAEGYRLYYIPEAEMYHLESVTTQGTPSLPNTRLIVKNGLRFKERWRHMFEHENGPSDEEARWRHLDKYDLSEIGDLPVLP